MSWGFFKVITNFADSALIFPLAFLLIAMLWYFESRKAAWLLFRAVAACAMAMVTLKLVFLSCNHLLGWPQTSPSGHASLAVVFYGSLATIIVLRLPRVWAWFAGMLALALVIVIAVSRVALGAHSASEVLAGLLVGALCLTWFAAPYAKMDHGKLRFSLHLLALGPLVLLILGKQLPAEVFLRTLVPHFKMNVCPADGSMS